MSKLSWLKEQLADWQKLNLVSASQAAAIMAHYESQPRISVARVVLSVIGAVLFGLGVILFFAWNWDAMSKPAKLGVVFSGLLLAQLSGVWFRLRVGNRSLGEGLLGLGTLLFGAGIILIAQIYHIDEHFPNAFVVWGLGALVMAWAVGSVAQGFLAVLLLGLWFGAELNSFHHPMHAAAPLIGLGLLPLAWRERSSWLFAVATLGFLITLLISAAYESGRWFFADALLLAATLVLVSGSVGRTAFPQIESTVRILGYLGYVAILYVFSFDQLDGVFRDPLAGDTVNWVYFSVLSAAALATLAVALKRELGGPRHIDQLHYALVVISTGLIVGALFLSKAVSGGVWVWANIALLIHAVIWIVVGSREQHGRTVAGAALLFAMVAVPRFLDLFDSLLMRALLFVALGAGLFLLGNFYQRQKKSAVRENMP